MRPGLSCLIGRAATAPHQTVDSVMPPVDICVDKVLSVLQSLDANSAAGPDNLHPILLRSCSSSLAYPLSVIFRQSLRDHCLPAPWKTSLVIPIFKKGARYNPLNYRPISLTSVICKCLERIISQQLTAYLEECSILSDNQYGFRSGRSTQDQLIQLFIVSSSAIYCMMMCRSGWMMMVLLTW